MRKVTFLLAVLAVGLGLFVAAALNIDRLDPVLNSASLDPDSWIFEEVLRAIAIVVVGAPLAALLWTVAGLGSDKAKTDIHGTTVLRLKAGTRFGFATLALILAGVSFFAVLVDDEATLAFKLVVPLFGLAFVWVAILLAVAKVRFDGTTICATGFTGRLGCNDWADLVEVRTNREAQEYVLVFRTGRKTRISFFYQDVRLVLIAAEKRLQQDARTARG